LSLPSLVATAGGFEAPATYVPWPQQIVTHRPTPRSPVRPSVTASCSVVALTRRSRLAVECRVASASLLRVHSERRFRAPIDLPGVVVAESA
jgi:hypothetical protein